MIDWHCHILPGMDDGSHDTAESLSLLRMQMSQGIDTVAATPHFYANDESAEAFLERRRASFAQLQAQLPADAPSILLGAEVRYYQGISRMEELEKLRIGDSRLLLLEMPFHEWTEYTVRELSELAARGTVRIMLAHVERYLKLQHRSVWERIFDSDLLIQSNADFFVSLATRHKALTLLRQGSIHFLGSDCHNLTSRPPKIGHAAQIIQKKFGDAFLSQMSEFGYAALADFNSES